MKKVKITQVKSQISTKQTHRKTLAALGLKKMHDTVELELTPSVKGMVDQVSYLLSVEEID